MPKDKVIIGIMGSHCTGKTTLMNMLAKRFKADGYKIKTISEVARRVRKDKLGTVNAQKQILFGMVKELERLNEQNFDVAITDRTLLDNLAYSVYYAIEREWETNEYKWIKESVKTAIAFMSVYDILIYADNVGKIPIVDDGFRLTDDRSRMIVDALCKFMWCMVKEYSNALCLEWNVDKDFEMFYWSLRSIVEKKLGDE